jgi:hypothetical protein
VRACLAALAALLCAAPAAGAATVQLRGTAYEFNNTDVRLAGAVIRVAKRPRLRTTTRRDGTYVLTVPDRARITPYITAPGYHSIHLQTFSTDREDLANVNFQVPTDAIYGGLAALLDVPLDADGDPQDCAVVSTFSTKQVRDKSFAGFVGHGAHGVAGAAASGSPALPAPTYFNEHVIPDPMQQLSSIDGGVVWTRVPAGAYTISAQHPTTRFADFVATCEPGRVINANPPWGLHELADIVPATITARWVGSDLRRLRVTEVPPGAKAEVRCAGPRCLFHVKPLRAGNVLDALDGRLRRGQVLTIVVAADGYSSKVARVRHGSSELERRCIPLGQTRVRRASRC